MIANYVLCSDKLCKLTVKGVHFSNDIKYIGVHYIFFF